MFKGFAIASTLVLLCSSAAFAVIGQAQSFLMDGSNQATIAGDAGAVGHTNTAILGQSQTGKSASGSVTTMQNEGGSLVQGASAAGAGGLLAVAQGGSGSGGQMQVQDGFNLGIQTQDLDASLGQQLYKSGGGIGAAIGIQALITKQIQFVVTPFGISANAQYVAAGQFTGTGGANDFAANILGGVDSSNLQNNTQN